VTESFAKNPKRILLTSLTLALAGCQSSPSRDILGSYFPSWMLCILIGVVLTLIARKILLRTGVDPFIHAKPLVYLGLTVSLTFFTWLAWFGN
jgi:Na+/glutamate symporter